MPFKVPVSKALQFLGPDIVVGVLSEWITPSLCCSYLTERENLSSNIVIWHIWLVRSK
jgi:hypothetical protein